MDEKAIVLLIALLVQSDDTDRMFYSAIIPKGAAMRHWLLTPDFQENRGF